MAPLLLLCGFILFFLLQGLAWCTCSEMLMNEWIDESTNITLMIWHCNTTDIDNTRHYSKSIQCYIFVFNPLFWVKVSKFTLHKSLKLWNPAAGNAAAKDMACRVEIAPPEVGSPQCRENWVLMLALLQICYGLRGSYMSFLSFIFYLKNYTLRISDPFELCKARIQPRELSHNSSKLITRHETREPKACLCRSSCGFLSRDSKLQFLLAGVEVKRCQLI